AQQPRMPGRCLRESLRLFGETKYPFFFKRINALHRGAYDCGSLPFPAPANPSLFRGEKVAVSERTGNRLQAIESAWRTATEPPQKAGNGRNFQQFPVNFPVFREFAATATDGFAEMRAIPPRLRERGAKRRVGRQQHSLCREKGPHPALPE